MVISYEIAWVTQEQADLVTRIALFAGPSAFGSALRLFVSLQTQENVVFIAAPAILGDVLTA